MSCRCCYESFSPECNTTEIYTPMVLPCGHSICKNCLYSLAKKACPVCRSPFQSCPSKFPCNYALMEQLSISTGQLRAANHTAGYILAKHSVVTRQVSLISVFLFACKVFNSNSVLSIRHSTIRHTKPCQAI